MLAALGAAAGAGGCGVPAPRPDPDELCLLLVSEGGGAMATGTPPEPLPPELVVRPRRDSSGDGTNESPNGSDEAAEGGGPVDAAEAARTGAGEPRAAAEAGAGIAAAAAAAASTGGDMRSICRCNREWRGHM